MDGFSSIDIGKRYCKLLILKEERRSDYKIWSYCKCDCGTEKWIAKYNIKNGNTKTCGKGSCRATYESDIGKRYNKLVVLKEDRKNNKARIPIVYCFCRCDCGNEKWVQKANLRNGATKSCGCLVTTHGQSKNKLYSTWSDQKDRCYNLNSIVWKSYGGRGITVYDGWINDFGSWLDYVENLPHYKDKDRSIDRIDNDKGYEPGNLKWATKSDQSNNRRSNVRLTYNSETHTISEWASKIGMSAKSITSRLRYGWSVEKTLSTPNRTGSRGIFKNKYKYKTSTMTPKPKRKTPNYNSDVGIRYGFWLIVEEKRESVHGAVQCYCKCDCGTKRWVQRCILRNGGSKSCGCSRATHGQSNTATYHLWSNIKNRCLNPNNIAWKDYGGRGIKMHEPWVYDFSSWKEYIEALPYYEEQSRSIDRIDNTKGYEPGNLRWATKTEQANNKRDNTYVTFRSETHTISEWSVITGITASAIGNRLRKGWTTEIALTTPIRKIKELHESDFKI